MKYNIKKRVGLGTLVHSRRLARKSALLRALQERISIHVLELAASCVLMCFRCAIEWERSILENKEKEAPSILEQKEKEKRKRNRDMRD